MPRETDPFRKHVQVLPNKRWKCNLCGNQYAGRATRIKAHLAGVGRYGTNDCKDVNGRVRSEARKALKGKGVVESSNGSGGNSLTQVQHQPETSSTAIPFLNPDDISSLGLNAEEGEPNTEVPQGMCIGKFTIPDARTRDGPLESPPPCSGVVVDKNMPHLLTKLEELSSREADMANLETWWRKVKRKGEYWSVVQAFRQGRPLSTSQLSQVEELSKEVEEILLRDRFRIESKTLAGFSKTVEVVNIPPPSAPDFDPEHQRTLIDFSSQEGWTYAIFWQSSYDHSPPQSAASSSSPPVPVLGFGDGYYKGEDKKPNRKVKISTSSAGEQEHRKRVLRELRSLIRGSDPNIDEEANDEGVTDTEWFFLVSMTESFVNGHRLPGQALLSSTPIWVSGADRLVSCGRKRAKQGMDFGLQTMVCIPAIGGAVELGSTELISSDRI